MNGDVIDPDTKRILKRAQDDSPMQAPAPEPTPVSPQPVATAPSSSMAEIIDALARKNVEAIRAQVEARTVELLKESIK